MSKPTRLLGALDNDVNIAVGKFLELGISADVDSLYTAIQRSNSSIKRKPKKSCSNPSSVVLISVALPKILVTIRKLLWRRRRLQQHRTPIR